MNSAKGLLLVAWFGVLGLVVAGVAPAQSVDPEQHGRWSVFPSDGSVPEAVADPYRPRNGMAISSYSSSDIDGVGDFRWRLELGGRFPIVRYGDPERPDRHWQLSIPAGFYSEFDLDNDTDNIGWDGIYGLILERETTGPFAFELGVVHHSSHIGDELIERTGRERIGYTREELMARMHWQMGERWRSYLGGGWGWTNRSELQEPARAQAGAVFEAPGSLWGGTFGWFVAADVQSFEERDWRVDSSVFAGLMARRSIGTWRVGLDYRDGRPPIGEFFEATERSWSFVLRYSI